LPTEVAAFGRGDASSTLRLELLGPWDVSETALDGRECFTIIALQREVKKNYEERRCKENLQNRKGWEQSLARAP
jgi:hypothetical protein